PSTPGGVMRLLRPALRIGWLLLGPLLILSSETGCAPRNAGQASAPPATATVGPAAAPVRISTITLSADDGRVLDGLMKDQLFDPKGARRVRAVIPVRNVRAETSSQFVNAWLVPGTNGQPGRLYLTTGAWISESDARDVQEIDFIAEWRAGPKVPLVEAAW